MKPRWLATLAVASAVGWSPAQAQIDVLENFTGTDGSTLGNAPKGSLIRSGSTLYGFTSAGGTNDYGVIFSVNTDGSDYTVIHHFSGPDNTDGNTPHHGYLTLLGDTLIRPMLSGGADGQGTIFTVTTSGSTHDATYTFTGSASAPTALGDGAQSHSGLLAGSNGVYYGITSEGGAQSGGVIFSYTASTGAVSTLYAFNPTTGANSHGQLIWDSTGTQLLGMSRSGGTGTGNSNTGNAAPGTIFSFNPQTGVYTTLYSFTSANNQPYFTDHGDLVLGTGSNSTAMFGMTEFGGTNDDGAIFALSGTGGDLITLHSFSGSTTDGKHPFGSLILGPDGLLYGLTRDGGTDDDGTLFRIAQDGTGFTLVASFTNETGINPIDNITFSADGLTVYGLTEAGGSDGDGTLFSFDLRSLDVPEPNSVTLGLLGATFALFPTIRRRLLAART